MKAVILTASKNDKFYPFSETRTRSMTPCAGDYILSRLVLQLKKIGITSIYLVVNHQREKIQNYLEYGQKLEIDLQYIVQTGSGIGNALLQAENQIAGEKFLLCYGDILTTEKHVMSLKPFIKDTSHYSIASVVHPFQKGTFGNVYLDHQMKITKIVEKTSEKKQFSNYILAGMYLFQNNVFTILKQKKEDMNQLFQELIKEGNFLANLSEERWIDISYPWNIIDANRIIMESWEYSIIPASVKIKKDVNIQGIVRLGENCKINSGSTIQGPCYIGDNTFIGNNCLIREGGSIANDCTIGFSSEIKSSILFQNVLLGRHSFIGDSVIGENVQIGNYCTTINYDVEGKNIFVFDINKKKIDTEHKKIGAFIGDNTIIGSTHSMESGLVIKNNQNIPNNISIRK